MPLANPRQVAYTLLSRIAKERSYADILLDRELTHGALQGPDRGLLTELVYGVLRRQGTLDYLVSQFSSVRIDRIERSVHILLRLGIYQLLYLDRIPASAAVNETVKLGKILAPKATGFINAVLREIDRKRDQIRWPDREKDPAAWIAARYSAPQWIARLWLDQLGAEEAEQLAASMCETPPVTVRANSLKCSRDELIDRLADEQVFATPCTFSPTGVRIVSHTPLPVLDCYRQGLFTIQDEASQLTAEILGPEPGETILDVCAAPGGKTTAIAELMRNSGEIAACDVNPRRLEQVTRLATRLGIGIITTTAMDAVTSVAPFSGKRFTRVLVDAPCSGLGVLRRNPEGKWWKSAEEIGKLAEIQSRILANASTTVAPDGILVYATCSTSAAENESIVDDFLSLHQNFVLEDIRETNPVLAPLCSEKGHFRPWPHRHGMDGFFAARLRRQETV